MKHISKIISKIVFLVLEFSSISINIVEYIKPEEEHILHKSIKLSINNSEYIRFDKILL